MAPAFGGMHASRMQVPEGQTLFQSYTAALRGAAADPSAPGAAELDDPGLSMALHKVYEHVTSLRTEGGAVCLICLENIGRNEAIWHCQSSCFTVLHLSCVQAWARQQLDQDYKRRLAARLSGAAAPQSEAELMHAARWGCPKCRWEAKEIPSEYRCFCGKERDPEFDAWSENFHSCNQTCGRQLSCGEPGHTCMVLCHPGPCPPCPRVVKTECGCGKRGFARRCGLREVSCGAVCDKALPCGHRCPLICHPGAPCPPCDLDQPAVCFCGGTKRVARCSELPLSCGKVHGALLACKRHTCTKTCHPPGECSACPNTGVRHCPCGKKVYGGLACDAVAPLCGDTCGRPCPRCKAPCKDRCHEGECSTCRVVVQKTCPCGGTTQRVQCSQEVRCERRCGCMRPCGRHACNRKCCDGDCPPCPEICGKKLHCGNHKCAAPCHSGPCLPCPVVLETGCACGRTTYALPCRSTRTVPPPACPCLCPLPSLCRHEATSLGIPVFAPGVGRLIKGTTAEGFKQHKCHFGPCPPCPLPCGTLFPCGHSCPVPQCHDGLPPGAKPLVADFAPPKVPGLGGFPPVGDAAEPALSKKDRQQLRRQQQQRGPEEGGAGGESAPSLDPTLPPSVRAAAQQAAVAMGPVITPCPPCMVPQDQTCVGGHATRAVPCHIAQNPQFQATPYRCGAACGAKLGCERHFCARECHDRAMEPCQPCERPCRAERPKGCSHNCPLKCHAASSPCPPCPRTVKMTCQCRRSALEVPCRDVQREAAEPGSVPGLDRCDKDCARQLKCGHIGCGGGCHSGACPHPDRCSQEVVVRCGCRRRRERWACSRAQAAVREAGQPLESFTERAPRLLPCDAECEAEAEARRRAREAAGAAAGASRDEDEDPGSTGDEGGSLSGDGTGKQDRGSAAAAPAGPVGRTDPPQRKAAASGAAKKAKKERGPGILSRSLAWLDGRVDRALGIRPEVLAPPAPVVTGKGAAAAAAGYPRNKLELKQLKERQQFKRVLKALMYFFLAVLVMVLGMVGGQEGVRVYRERRVAMAALGTGSPGRKGAGRRGEL